MAGPNAAANHATVTEVMARLRAGDLVRSAGPLPNAHAIGMGQSMGGCFLIVEQGNHDDLLAAGGTYARLSRLQNGRALETAGAPLGRRPRHAGA